MSSNEPVSQGTEFVNGTCECGCVVVAGLHYVPTFDVIFVGLPEERGSGFDAGFEGRHERFKVAHQFVATHQYAVHPPKNVYREAPLLRLKNWDDYLFDGTRGDMRLRHSLCDKQCDHIPSELLQVGEVVDGNSVLSGHAAALRPISE
jgi:hypothetical protein